MNCQNCKKEFTPKRADVAKFCSVNCRVQYNRTHPKEKVTKVQMQSLYNTIMDKLGELPSIKYQPTTKESYDGKRGITNEDEPLTFRTTNKQKTEIDFLNQISQCEFEEEYRKVAEEIRESGLPKRTVERLLSNMSQSKL